MISGGKVESQEGDYFEIEVTLRTKTRQFSFKDQNYIEGNRCFWWEEGNGACDCNRSLFISRQCDPAFPVLDCGDTIALIEVKKIKELPRRVEAKN